MLGKLIGSSGILFLFFNLLLLLVKNAGIFNDSCGMGPVEY
jgi:hypothetical protein